MTPHGAAALPPALAAHGVESIPEETSGPDANADRIADRVAVAQARFERPLLAYVARILCDAHEARDVVHDVFLRLMSADPGDTEGRMAAWLYTVARRRAIDVKRRACRIVAHDREDTAFDPSAPESGPADRAAAKDDLAVAGRAMAGLSPLQAEAVRLKLGHGLSYAEIGAVMGVQPSYAGYLICVGLKAVRHAVRGSEGVRSASTPKGGAAS